MRLFIVNYAETVLPKGYNIIFSETAQANEAAIPEFVHGLKVVLVPPAGLFFVQSSVQIHHLLGTEGHPGRQQA